MPHLGHNVFLSQIMEERLKRQLTKERIRLIQELVVALHWQMLQDLRVQILTFHTAVRFTVALRLRRSCVLTTRSFCP